MKKINYLFITAVLCFSSCKLMNHEVPISEDVPVEEYSNQCHRGISLKVVDSREDKEYLGSKELSAVWKFKEEYKHPEHLYKTKEAHLQKHKITNSQNLSEVVLHKFEKSLVAKGLEVNKAAPNQIKVEVLELGIVSTMYRNFIYSKIKIIVDTRLGSFSKIYYKQITNYRPMAHAILLGPFDPGLSGKYYDKMINKSLDKNIEDIFNDEKVWDVVRYAK